MKKLTNVKTSLSILIKKQSLFALAQISVLTSSHALAQPTVPLPRASITAADMGVVIISGDPTSEAIGAYYQSARGIPANNVVRISLPAGYGIGSTTIPANLFSALKTQVDAALPANVQATLLTWTMPFKVGEAACSMSITSAFALGYDKKYCGINQAVTASVPYFDSSSTTPWQDFGIRPSMMLGASSLAAAKTLIDRGVEADNTYPVGDGYLIRTTDMNRSLPRKNDFESLPNLWNYPQGLKLSYLNNEYNAIGSDYIQGKSPVLFYFTGLTSVPGLTTNTFIPGAIGDHLTSFGGVLSGTGQMAATKWLEAGATATYGTVEEPFANYRKFPQASIVIDQYYRGATLIEAYWKSVKQPGQGLFLGEPLARPYADKASSTIVGNEYVLNTRNLRRDSEYIIQSRNDATSAWVDHAKVSTTLPMQQEYHAPLNAKANELKLKEVRIPFCPPATTKSINIVSPDDTIRSTSIVYLYDTSGLNTVDAQGGHEQTVYFQMLVQNGTPEFLECANKEIALSIQNPPNGIIATITPSTFNLKTGEYAIATIAVTIPANIAQTENTTKSLNIMVTDTIAGIQSMAESPLTINLLAGNDSQAPLLRINRPTKEGWLLDYPERTSSYAMPMEADVSPTSGITDVTWDIQTISLDDGSDPSAFGLIGPGGSGGGLQYTTYLNKLAPGQYRLIAKGYDENGSLVATTDTEFYTDVQVSYIRGNFSANTIKGTTGNEIINGGYSADTLTGGGGFNVYQYTNINDGVDTITDFVPGKDRIDISRILINLGYTSDTALKNEVFRIIDINGNATVQVDRDGKNRGVTFVNFITLKGILAKNVDLARDLQLVPRAHLFAPAM